MLDFIQTKSFNYPENKIRKILEGQENDAFWVAKAKKPSQKGAALEGSRCSTQLSIRSKRRGWDWRRHTQKSPQNTVVCVL